MYDLWYCLASSDLIFKTGTMKKPSVNALIASIGSGLEYFSFITFAFQAQYLTLLFFPKDSTLQGMMNTFLIFAVGSFVTLGGGLLFGYYGDRLGRKKTFTYSILLMSLASLGIAVLPTGMGVVSLGLLVLFRILQGISQGAELPGAITFITEHARDQNKGFLCGTMFLGVGLGAGLATSINVVLTKWLSFEQMLSYGWRLPFFAAVFLGGLGFVLRRRATETPVFIAMPKISVRLEWRPILHGFLLVALGAVLVSLGLYWPALLTSVYHFEGHVVFLAMMIAFIVTAFFLPVFGALGDRYGHGKIYVIGVVLLMIVLPGLFPLLKTGDSLHLILFAVIYYFIIVILAGNYPVMLAALFPPQTRYFSVALSYTGCYAVASFAPAWATFLFLHGGGLGALLGLIEGVGILSLIAGLWYCKKIKPSSDSQ